MGESQRGEKSYHEKVLERISKGTGHTPEVQRAYLRREGRVMTDADKAEVAAELLQFASKLHKKEVSLTPDPVANGFVVANPLALLLGVLYDERRNAERVWEMPYRLFEALGHLDPSRIAAMGQAELVSVFEAAGLTYLSRYQSMAGWTIGLCRTIVGGYGGDARNVWTRSDRPPTAAEIARRLEEFDGIGPGKASMGVRILVRDFGIPITGSRRTIDVSGNRHVKRMFLRTGLVDEDTSSEIEGVARALSPDYPGALDLPAWEIGRRWCHPTDPLCAECALEKCRRLTYRVETE